MLRNPVCAGKHLRVVEKLYTVHRNMRGLYNRRLVKDYTAQLYRTEKLPAQHVVGRHAESSLHILLQPSAALAEQDYKRMIKLQVLNQRVYWAARIIAVYLEGK